MSTILLQSYYHLKRGGATQQQTQQQQQPQIQPRIHVNPFQRQSFSPTSNSNANSPSSAAQVNYNLETVHYRHPRHLGPFQPSPNTFKTIIDSPSSTVSSCPIGRPLSVSYAQQQRYLYPVAVSPANSNVNLGHHHHQHRVNSGVVGRCGAGTEVVLRSPLPSGGGGAHTLSYPLVSYSEASLVQGRAVNEAASAVGNKATTADPSIAAAASCSPNAASYTPMQVLCAVCCLRTRVKEPVHLVQQDNKPFLWTGEISSEQEKMKKSVSGGNLRSPNVKRSVESPVTIRGWLYKQGSDGLMLWKKRWFVLSEYCLFYYKGPEEDKILGSILLPSYTITPCDSNDHIYRKFAFKAEHQNMRTYFFAAENKKEMQQWMNTMSLASILQNQNHNVDESLDRVSKEMSSNHNRREEEDPGFSIYQPRRPTDISPSNDGALISRHHNANDYPNSYMMNDPENSFHSDDVPYLQPAHHNYLMSSRYPVESRMDQGDHHNSMEFGGGNNVGGQPMGMSVSDSGSGVPRSQHHLYANAPPKPKRMGSSRDLIYESHVEAIPLPSYHSAAATAVIAKPRSPFVESAGYQQQYAVSPGRPPREYMTELTSPARRALPEEFQQSNVVMVSHRRTPDPYARTVPPHMFANEMGDKQYREDEYAATIAAVAGKMHARSPHGDLQSPSHGHSRKYPQQKIQNVRPQSAADFLETDIYSDGGGSSSSRVNNNVGYKQLPQTHQHSARNVLSRPMSSIEPQMGLSDDICGDVERFKGSLKKGRNSPSVLYGSEKDASRKTPEVMYRENENLVRTQQQSQSLITTNPLCNKSFDSHSNNNNNIAALSSENYRKAAQRASTPTMTLTSSSSLAALDRTTPLQQINSQTSTPTPAWNQIDPNYTLPRDRSFLRSYSARFPGAAATSTSAQTDGYRDGSSQYDTVKTNGGGSGGPALKIQQREESMKRLLEWKQRMLQSPLTRKYIPKSDSSSTFQKQVHLMASSAATTPSSTMISALETLQSRQQSQPAKHRLSQPPMSTSFHTPDGNEMKRYLPGEDHRIPRTQSAMQVGLRNSSEVEPRLLPEMMKDRFGKPIHSAPNKSPARLSNRIQDHRRSTSSLNRFYSSYSSDDEDELRGQLADANFTRSQSVKIGSSRSAKKSRDTVDYVNISTLNNNDGYPRPQFTREEEDDEKGPEYVNLARFQDRDVGNSNVRYRCHSEPSFLHKNHPEDGTSNEDWLDGEQTVDDEYLYRSKTPDCREINVASRIETRYFQDGSTQTVNQLPLTDNSWREDSSRTMTDFIRCPLAVQEDDASSVEEVRMKDRMYHGLVLGNSCNRDWKCSSTAASKKQAGGEALVDEFVTGGEDLALEPPEQFRSPAMESSEGLFVWTPCQPPKSHKRTNQQCENFNRPVEVAVEIGDPTSNGDERLNCIKQENSPKNIVQDRIKIFEAQSEVLSSRLVETQILSKQNPTDVSTNSPVLTKEKSMLSQGPDSLMAGVSPSEREASTSQMMPEEYYLPMNGSGLGAVMGSGNHHNTGGPDFRTFALAADEHSRSSLTADIDEAVYVQMDNTNILGVSPKSVFAPHERLMNSDGVGNTKSNESLKSLKDLANLAASPTDFRLDTLSFDNFGYYQIPDLSEMDIEGVKNASWEPIYAEPGAQGDLTDATTSSSEGRSSNDVGPSLPQRNNSLMMRFILNDEKSSSTNDLLNAQIQEQPSSLRSSTDRSERKNEGNPRFSLSDSFRPASYYLKMPSSASSSVNESCQPINKTNICPENINDNHEKRDQEMMSVNLDHFQSLFNPSSSSISGNNSGNHSLPPLSPLHSSNLNYSYYRVYEDDHRTSAELITKPLSVSLPLKQTKSESPPSSDHNRNEFQDDEKQKEVLSEEKIASKSQLPNFDLKDAETQWSPTVSVSSFADTTNEMGRETPSTTTRTTVTVPTVTAASPNPSSTPINVTGSQLNLSKRLPSSAPYYYSDLLKDDGRPPPLPPYSPPTTSGTDMSSNPTPSTSSGLFRPLMTFPISRSSHLNNINQPRFQLDDGTRKVSNIELAQNRSLMVRQSTMTSRVDATEPDDPLTAVTSQLTDSIVYWEAKKLSGTEHNFYESDTLRKRAWNMETGSAHPATSLESDARGIDVRNLYPHGILSEKLSRAVPRLNYFSGQQSSTNLPHRSRSLEGLLFGANPPLAVATPDISQPNSRTSHRQSNAQTSRPNSNLNRAMSVGSCLNQTNQTDSSLVGRNVGPTTASNVSNSRLAEADEDRFQPSLDAVRFPGDGEDDGAARASSWTYPCRPLPIPSSHQQHHRQLREDVGLPVVEPNRPWNYFLGEVDRVDSPNTSCNDVYDDRYSRVASTSPQMSHSKVELASALEVDDNSANADHHQSASNDKVVGEYLDEFVYDCHRRNSPIKWDQNDSDSSNIVDEPSKAIQDISDQNLNSESWSASSMQNDSENWLTQSGLSSQQQRFLAKRKYRSESPNVVDASASQMNASKQPELHNFQEVNVSESLMDAQKKLQKMKFNLSAGDLLGKSHEELVLLLIQLRRDQTKLEHKLNKCRVELEARQRLIQMNSLNSSDQNVPHKQMLQQYDEMAKQYELTKPLVNLVDNMVKLGSLYGGSEQLFDPKSRPESSNEYSNPKKMLEFSRLLQEQRLQNENQFTDWYHLQQLEQKLQEASKLDTVLLEESHVVSDLQQDKDMLEKVVENLRSKLNSCRDSPVELEKLQKQLRTAEKELLKIRNQLSQGAQKLEETAADNARIENEIGMLRQRVQSSIIQGLGNDNSSKASYIKVQLEKELSRISNVMEDLAWKRKELSGALEQLKDRNKALLADVRASPTGVSGSIPLPSRKNHRSTYLETDLDTMETKDIIESWKQGEGTYSSDQKSDQLGGLPLYVNTYASSTGSDDASTVTASSVKEDIDSSIDSEQFRSDAYEPQDIVEADDRTKRYYGLIPRDKPAEIKTVRIVKRESERRSKVRDRRKSDLDGDGSLVKIGEEAYEPGYSEQPELSEETMQMCHTMSLPRNFGQSLTDSNGFSSSTMLGLKLTPTNVPGNDSVSTPSSTTSGKNVSYYYRTPSLSSLNSEPSSPSSFSARDRLFGRSTVTTTTTVTSFSSSHHPNRGFSSSPTSISPMTTPTFKSETARKIVAETAASDILSNQTGRSMHDSLLVAEQSEPEPVVISHDNVKCKADGVKRRQKRRAYTISSSQPLTLETTMQRMVHARSRDDLDIEQCLRSANAPDVVKSTIKNEFEKFDESTIDRELGLPQKIVIPERYVEETSEEPSPAEQLHRLQKAESIRKMLSESTTYGDSSTQEEVQSSTLKKKFEADRKQREHLLALNQIIAKEVMERSKAVAASFTGPLDNK